VVTAAVPAKEGRIFLQLWRVRRIPLPHPALQPDRMLPVAPAASPPAGEAFIKNEVGGEPSFVGAFCSALAGGSTVGGFGLGPPSHSRGRPQPPEAPCCAGGVSGDFSGFRFLLLPRNDR
jgi:hypothetical protein